MARLPFLRRVALKTLPLRPESSRALLLLLPRPLSDVADDDPPFCPKPPGRAPRPRKEPAGSSPAGDPDCRVGPDLPFDFRYSYSETSAAVEPIGFREPPRFSPFGPGRIDRTWTGTSAPALVAPDPEKAAGERERVLGAPLSEEEVAELVERYRHSDCNRQINLAVGELEVHWP